MKNEALEYIGDDGFTAGVVRSLPKRRVHPATRRMLLILSFCIVGYTIVVGMAWSDIVQFATWLGKMHMMFNLSTMFAVSFGLAVILGAAAFCFAKKESTL